MKQGKSKSLNDVVRRNQVETVWQWQELAETCYRFFDIFNRAFFEGSLPTCFLQFERSRSDNLGHYRPGRNRVGAEHEINLNIRNLNRPACDILKTLLHEMTHEWQALHGTPGRGKYHNIEFTEKCASLGIPCTGGNRSYTTGYDEPFVSLLRRNGVEAAVGPLVPKSVPPAPPGGRSKMKKWSCGCTNIRAAVEIDVTCNKCGGRFSLN